MISPFCFSSFDMSFLVPRKVVFFKVTKEISCFLILFNYLGTGSIKIPCILFCLTILSSSFKTSISLIFISERFVSSSFMFLISSFSFFLFLFSYD